MYESTKYPPEELEIWSRVVKELFFRVCGWVDWIFALEPSLLTLINKHEDDGHSSEKCIVEAVKCWEEEEVCWVPINHLKTNLTRYEYHVLVNVEVDKGVDLLEAIVAMQKD